MCIAKTNLINNNEKMVKQSENHNWTQLFRKPLKPKLTRKIVKSAKVNINRYWNKFEEFLSPDNQSSSSKIDSADTVSVQLLPIVNRTIKQKYNDSAHHNQQRRSELLNQNNIQDEINSFMRKRFVIEKNVARTSMYKHFNDESLYHGVNLNAPRQRCSCSDIVLPIESKYNFSHRNIQLSMEDKENLENEAIEVFANFAYDTSF